MGEKEEKGDLEKPRLKNVKGKEKMARIIKRGYEDMEEASYPQKKRLKLQLKLEDAPSVHNIKDLIQIGKTIKFYKNLDTVMLWRIVPYLEELDRMVGMASLKESIFYQIIYYLQGMHKKGNSEYLHTALYSPPGGGKTTVAKILGKLYQAMGILSENGIFKVITRDMLIASFLGQSAIKTKKLLESCLGGVALIDEAYSLGPRDTDRDSFAKEVIDTLNSFLSEHKDNFCCIIAGYEEDVRQCFFAMNKGLERRFPWVHRIETYTEKDLSLIFAKMVREIDWKVSFEDKFLIDLIRHNKELFKHSGGSIEVFLTKAKMFHAKRVFGMAPEHKFILNKDDVREAIEYMKKNTVVKEDLPPFGLYT